MLENLTAAIKQAWEAEPAHDAVQQIAKEWRRPIYIVGGAVRDALLRRPVQDWDFVARGVPRLAETIAQRVRGRLVLLHERTMCFRIVLERHNPEHCLDLSELHPAGITADLGLRDVSINAIAYDVRSAQLIDPCGGLQDLRNGLLRTPARQNLQNDPVRLLRIYRFVSELGFHIEAETHAWLNQLAPLVADAPAERLGQELWKLLHPARTSATLQLMDEDGVLCYLIPEITPMRGMEQGGYHHLDVWGHTLHTIAELEKLLLQPEEAFPRTQEPIRRYLQQKHIQKILLMAALLHDFGKPPTRTQEEGRWRFLGHERVGAEMALNIVQRFCWRRKHAQIIRLLVAHHLWPLHLANLAMPQDGRLPQEITPRALLRMFQAVQPHGIGLLLLALADARACLGPATTAGYHERLAAFLDQLLDRYLQWLYSAQAQPLLSGTDLIAAGYKPGKHFGVVLKAVQEAQAEGRIHTKEEALALAQEILREKPADEAISPASEEP